jgi:hypothetical protein
MDIEEFKKEAEKHWTFIEKLLRVDNPTSAPAGLSEKAISICHLLYVEAMCHGFKHAKEDK